jgi:Nucleotide modification associated domain 3
MSGLLVRVGADLTDEAHWNGPVDSQSGEFVYIPIVETKPLRPGLGRSYDELTPALRKFRAKLPLNLEGKLMHLDPDFREHTYGDQGRRAAQIRQLTKDDMLAFYASLRARDSNQLIYALIGIFVVEEIILAKDATTKDWPRNAHTRRIPGDSDIVVKGDRQRSGRLKRCIPIGEYRDRAYRIRRDLLEHWGGLSVRDGYVQRSARLPSFLNAEAFLAWLRSKNVQLIHRNN